MTWDTALERRRGERSQTATVAPVSGDRVARARAYLAEMPPAISGSGGHVAAFNAARKLADFGLTEGEIFSVLTHDYNPRCQPPWTEAELAHKAADAFHKREPRPIADRPRHDAPKLRRVATRPTGGDEDREYSDDDAPDAPPDESDTDAAPEAAQPSALESRWIDLGNALEFVREAPPPQTWLLTQWHGQTDHGVFPRGKTGLLTATGGAGKTYALTQLAIAVASGGFWFETFRASEPGHVLIALGEEDAEEARRRIWRVLNAAGLSADQRADVATRLHLLPLHGIPVALTYSPAHGVVEQSGFAIALRDRLESYGVDWSLVILDPLSRWAGGGIEGNNEAATRFVQVVESLTTVRGNPSLLVAHHSSQASTRTGESDARGVTGIRDGFRWMASMDGVVTEDGSVDGVALRNGKSNYSLRFRPMLLVRNTERGIEGTLRLASESESTALRAMLPKERQSLGEREQARQSHNRDAFAADCSRILALVPLEPSHTTGIAIEAGLRASGCPKGDKTIKAILERLMADGRIVDLSNGTQSRARQWARRES